MEFSCDFEVNNISLCIEIEVSNHIPKNNYPIKSTYLPVFPDFNENFRYGNIIAKICLTLITGFGNKNMEVILLTWL